MIPQLNYAALAQAEHLARTTGQPQVCRVIADNGEQFEVAIEIAANGKFQAMVPNAVQGRCAANV